MGMVVIDDVAEMTKEMWAYLDTVMKGKVMDIVERLRFWGTYGVSKKDLVKYSNEAADEIKRLREENNDLKSALRNVLFAEVSHVKVTEFTKEEE